MHGKAILQQSAVGRNRMTTATLMIVSFSAWHHIIAWLVGKGKNFSPKETTPETDSASIKHAKSHNRRHTEQEKVKRFRMSLLSQKGFRA
jgi:hypothetical protein